MAYCRKCGKLLAENANHCTVCGTPVNRQQNKFDTGRLPKVTQMDEPRIGRPEQPQEFRQPRQSSHSIRLGSPSQLHPLHQSQPQQPQPLHQSRPMYPSQPPQQPQPQPEPPKKKPGGTLIGLYILLGVLILALLGVGAWLLLGKSGGSKSDPNLGRYNAVSCSADGVEVPVDGEYVVLKKKGKAVLRLEEPVDATWTLEDEELTVSTEEEEYTGTLDDGVLTLEVEDKHYTFEKEEEPEDEPSETSGTDQLPATTEPTQPKVQDQTWWEGDWYGWWTVLKGSGQMNLMEQAAWDVCARITVNEDGTCNLHIWDQHPGQEQFVWLVDGILSEGSDDRGVFVSREGTFRGAPVSDLTGDPAAMPYAAFPDMLCLTGTYTDPENPANNCTYSIILRPWGAEWEDVRAGDMTGMPYPDMLPILYDSWYLPLIREGAPMPDAFN